MKATKTDILREIYRRSFYDFCIEAFKQLHNGQPMDENWHIEYLCEVLQVEAERIVAGKPRTKHLLINVPPRTLKSELVNVFFSVYLWTLKDSIQFISSSYSASLSISLSVQARRLIDSDWFRHYFPDVILSKDENTKSKYTTITGGLRYCTSTGGTVTGMGADVFVIDDPQNPQLARSETERENANTFFNETVRSRLNDPETGMFIVIMQRLHENDLTGMLLDLEPNEWTHICLPAEVSDRVKPIELKSRYDDGLLFFKRLSAKVLKSFKLGLGSYGYSGQYDQSPSPAEGGILKSKWFNVIDDIRIDGEVVPLDKLTWDFFFDTAYTKKQENDPSAMFACSYYENNLYIRSVEIGRYEFPELVKEINSFIERNGYDTTSMAHVEPKASGHSIVQQIRHETKLNIIEGKPPDTDKISRANGISPFVETGRCYLLRGHWNEAFLDELNAFPNGKHDDRVDCLVMAVEEYNVMTEFYLI